MSIETEDKRELAEMLAPHLAWDLTRSEVFRFQSTESVSGAAAEMFINDIVVRLRRKIHECESFRVAIIPTTK